MNVVIFCNFPVVVCIRNSHVEQRRWWMINKQSFRNELSIEHVTKRMADSLIYFLWYLQGKNHAIVHSGACLMINTHTYIHTCMHTNIHMCVCVWIFDYGVYLINLNGAIETRFMQTHRANIMTFYVLIYTSRKCFSNTDLFRLTVSRNDRGSSLKCSRIMNSVTKMA